MCPQLYCDYIFLKTCTLVTEANVTFLRVLDNDVSIPVPVEYTPKSTKAKQVTSTTSDYTVGAQTCAGCLQQCTSEHIFDVASAIVLHIFDVASAIVLHLLLYGLLEYERFNYESCIFSWEDILFSRPLCF